MLNFALFPKDYKEQRDSAKKCFDSYNYKFRFRVERVKAKSRQARLSTQCKVWTKQSKTKLRLERDAPYSML